MQELKRSYEKELERVKGTVKRNEEVMRKVQKDMVEQSAVLEKSQVLRHSMEQQIENKSNFLQTLQNDIYLLRKKNEKLKNKCNQYQEIIKSKLQQVELNEIESSSSSSAVSQEKMFNYETTNNSNSNNNNNTQSLKNNILAIFEDESNKTINLGTPQKQPQSRQSKLKTQTQFFPSFERSSPKQIPKQQHFFTNSHLNQIESIQEISQSQNYSQSEHVKKLIGNSKAMKDAVAHFIHQQTASITSPILSPENQQQLQQQQQSSSTSYQQLIIKENKQPLTDMGIQVDLDEGQTPIKISLNDNEYLDCEEQLTEEISRSNNNSRKNLQSFNTYIQNNQQQTSQIELLTKLITSLGQQLAQTKIDPNPEILALLEAISDYNNCLPIETLQLLQNLQQSPKDSQGSGQYQHKLEVLTNVSKKKKKKSISKQQSLIPSTYQSKQKAPTVPSGRNSQIQRDNLSIDDQQQQNYSKLTISEQRSPKSSRISKQLNSINLYLPHTQSKTQVQSRFQKQAIQEQALQLQVQQTETASKKNSKEMTKEELQWLQMLSSQSPFAINYSKTFLDSMLINGKHVSIKVQKLQQLSKIGIVQETTKKRMIIRTNSVNLDAANLMFIELQKILIGIVTNNKNEQQQQKPKSTKNLFKYIVSIYQDKLKQVDQENQTPLYIATYDYFLNKFGFKKIAEQKIITFMTNILLSANTHPQIELFQKFFGLPVFHQQDIQSGSIYNYDDMKIYLKIILGVDDQHNFGSVVINNLVQNNQCMILTSKLIDILNKCFKKQQIDLKILEEMKEQFLRDELTDLNTILPKVLTLYEENKIQILNKLMDIYLPADIDNDLSLSYDEYQLLYRHFEKSPFSKLRCKELFSTYADFIDDKGQQSMSFGKFAICATENNLFGDEMKLQFLGENNSQLYTKEMNQLEKIWKQEIEQIKLRFEKSNQFSKFHRNMIQKMENYFLMEATDQASFPITIIWTIYKLLLEESKSTIMEKIIDDDIIPLEIKELQAMIEELLIKKFDYQ